MEDTERRVGNERKIEAYLLHFINGIKILIISILIFLKGDGRTVDSFSNNACTAVICCNLIDGFKSFSDHSSGYFSFVSAL